MRPTPNKRRLWFWGVCGSALFLDLITKYFWGQPATIVPVWRAVLLLAMLYLLLSRLFRAPLSQSMIVGLALLAAGVIGNSVDVIAVGAIRDWLPFIIWQTNLADIFVWIGLVTWLCQLSLGRKN